VAPAPPILWHSVQLRQHISAYAAIIMETVRDKWTDERLDDLNQRVSDGFNRVDADLRQIRDEIGGLRTEMNIRFDAFQRTMLQLGAGIIATLMASIVSILLG
jgi:phosphosulfolactate synthase (CoM biosynthesis protein A)